MHQLVLWINIVGFALMVASTGVFFLVYNRNRHRWLLCYLLYAGAFTLWLLASTYVYFQDVFLDEPISQLETVTSYLQAVFSVVILVFGSLFFLGLADGPLHRRRGAVTAAVAAVVVAMMVVAIGFGRTEFLSYVRLLFSAYLAFAAWYASARVTATRHRPQVRLSGFLVFSGVAYTCLTAASIALLIVPAGLADIPIDAIATGAFLGCWSVLSIFIGMRWVAGKSSGGGSIPSSFYDDFDLSPREREIAEALAEGLTSREIGDKLFISVRTVETHVFSIYRKCGVSSRVEFVNKIADYT